MRFFLGKNEDTKRPIAPYYIPIIYMVAMDFLDALNVYLKFEGQEICPTIFSEAHNYNMLSEKRLKKKDAEFCLFEEFSNGPIFSEEKLSMHWFGSCPKEVVVVE